MDLTRDLQAIGGKVHLVGIGGIGMSALARILLARGIGVSGSDREASKVTDDLEALGAKIYLGHLAENVDGAGLVVVSTAINEANPEIAAARQKSLKIWHRSELLSAVSAESKLVAISGTHGKTTTTGMVSQVLLDGGLDPSVVIGGIFSRIGSNAHFGVGEYFVAEADESDGTHAKSKPYISVITNIEAEHLDNYPGGLAQICDNMAAFANNSQDASIICLDDDGCKQILPKLKGRVITYGSKKLSPNATYTYESVNGFSLRVYREGVELGLIKLGVPGEHNKLNALSAVAVGLECGLTFAQIGKGLASFAGVNRRFQILGQAGKTYVIDDYAHHPTEVAATLAAARQFKQLNNLADTTRIVAVFQPHQPGRLRDLWQEFCGAFTFADLVLVTDIYIARGGALEGISSEKFVKEVKHKNAYYLPGETKELAAQIAPYLLPGDLVLTIGAGDITKLGSELLRLLQQG
jgi:UDP-N-acetylmuramate--alanine ligase